MKKYVIILSFIMMFFTIFSCQKIEKVHMQWASPEEILFVGKIDSIELHSGLNRVEIVGKTNYLRTATTCEVEVGDTIYEYKIKDIDQNDGYVRFIVDDLKQGQYYINITTFDDEHNKSLTTKVFAEVYGPDTKLLCKQKTIRSYWVQPQGALDLGLTSATPTYVMIEYEKSDGTIGKLEFNPSLRQITLPIGWKSEGKATIKQYYRLKEDDIDIFYLDDFVYTMPAHS